MSAMTAEAKKLRDELCVYGFIRVFSSSCDIPDVLKQICLSFYLIVSDLWNVELSNNKFEIDNEQLTLKLNKESGTHGWPNAFGSLIITKGEYQIWKLKITNDRESRRTVMFGVINVDSNLIHSNDFCSREDGYGYYAWNGDKFDQGERDLYGVGWNEDDIITMTLDMTGEVNKKYGVVSYKVNDDDQGIAFKKLDINKRYCMAVSMFDKDDLQLVVD